MNALPPFIDPDDLDEDDVVLDVEMDEVELLTDDELADLADSLEDTDVN